MRNEYRTLLRDTRLYLLEQKKKHFFLPKNMDLPVHSHSMKEEKPLALEAPPPPSPPPPKKPEKKPEVKTAPLIKREAPIKKVFDPLLDVKKDLLKIANIKIHDEVPSDKEAKRRAESYRYKNQASPLTILRFEEKDKAHIFLNEIALALSNTGKPCRVVDAAPIHKEKGWETFLSANELEMIIACDYAIWQDKDLVPFYRENPTKSECFLQNTPLFLLPDLTLYFKDPLLKKSLWKALCQKIQTL